MIQGRSNFVYRIKGKNTFISKNLKKDYDTQALHVDVNIVNNDELDIQEFKNWQPEFSDADFILENGKYICGWEIEKMSKSLYNVVNPDDLIDKYGADTLRMYEMFLGPIEQAKPWDTNGIEGVFRFLKKFWRLFHNANGEFYLSNEQASEEERKILHRTIKKITDDIERFSFNTGVSNFMICINELGNCNKREVLEPLVILLSPYAPYIAEELWEKSGNNFSISHAEWPDYNEKYLREENFEYPVSFNGKMRFKLEMPIDASKDQIIEAALDHEMAQKWIEGKTIIKTIVVPKKIINIVVK